MKRRKLLYVVCIIAMVAGMGTASCAAPQPAKVFELTFAMQHPGEAPMNKVVNAAWAKWLEKESDGRVKLILYPGEQAAKGPELYDAARTGVVDIACQMIGFHAGRWHLTEVTYLPLIFEFPGSRAAALTAMALYDKYPEMQAEHKEVKVLGFHANGPSHIHTVKKPVHAMEDMKGLVVDTAGKWGVATIQALGASAETFFPGERYDAMAKGVIDANALEWEGQFVWSLNELTNYSTQIGLYLFTFIHVMNLDTWNSLPSDIQKLFVGENAKQYFTLHGYNFDKDDIMFRGMLDEQYKARGKEGIYVLTPEERARWVAAVMPLREQWVQEAAAVVGEAKARAILEDCLEFAKQYSTSPEEVSPEYMNILREMGVPGY